VLESYKNLLEHEKSGFDLSSVALAKDGSLVRRWKHSIDELNGDMRSIRKSHIFNLNLRSSGVFDTCSEMSFASPLCCGFVWRSMCKKNAHSQRRPKVVSLDH